MATWVETPREGRDRGLTGILRAQVVAVVYSRRFFRNGVTPGDQTPSLVLIIVIALVYQGLGLASEPATIPAIEGDPLVSALVALLVVTLFVAPALLHLMAAIQMTLLIPLLSCRAGVSETVQIITYAAAPCTFTSLPIPDIRALRTVYGAVLLVVGISRIHQTTVLRAALATVVSAGVVLGYAFDGFRALSELVVTLTLA